MSTGEWVSDNDGTAAWIIVQMNGQKYVSELEIKSRCANFGYRKVKEVKMEFDDHSNQTVITILRDSIIKARVESKEFSNWGQSGNLGS